MKTNALSGQALVDKVAELKAQGMTATAAMKQLKINNSNYYYWTGRLKKTGVKVIDHGTATLPKLTKRVYNRKSVTLPDSESFSPAQVASLLVAMRSMR